jgi:O-antigen/teichoic acid export membrane protein
VTARQDPDAPGGPSSHSRSELRSATLAGIRWVSLVRLVAEITGFAASVILARLLPPAEFGRAAIALLAAAVAAVVMNQGVGAALIQMRSARKVDLQTATALAFLAAVLFGALLVAVAELVIGPLLGDRIATLMELSCAAFVPAAFGAVPQAVLQRRLAFQRLAVIQVVSVLCGSATSVLLAATTDIDAEALVAGAVTSAAVSSVLAMASVRLEAPRLDRGAARGILSFGAQSGLAALFYTVFRRIDYVILGARLSAADVGFYWRAYQLGVEYQTKFTTIMLRIAFPVFSRTANLDDMRAIRARTVRLHAVVVLPALGGFIAVAPVLVPWLYGDAWEPSVVPAQVLAVVGMGAAIVTGIGPMLLAAGKPRVLMIQNLVTLGAYAGTVYLLAPRGLTAICLGVLAVQAVNFVASQLIILQRILGVPAKDLWREVLPGGTATVAVLAVVYPLVDRMSAAGVGSTLIVVVAAVAATGIATTIVWRLFPAAWADVLLGVGAVRPRPSRS